MVWVKIRVLNFIAGGIYGYTWALRIKWHHLRGSYSRRVHSVIVGNYIKDRLADMQHVPLWSTEVHLHSLFKKAYTSNITRDSLIGIVTTLQANYPGLASQQR